MKDTVNRRAGTTYPFHLELDTRFTDTDLGGHLNNVSIVLYYRDAQARFMLDCFPDLAAQSEWTPRQVRCDVSYDGQTYYPDPVDVACGVEEVGDSWVRVAQALFQRGQYVGQCSAVLALVDSQGQHLAISPEQRARLETRRLRA
ncbi:MAG: acyl-CoA thioesterase [Rhodocyclaceae bacterium]|jgi:acyl-CoA thioester hydrolase|nr:acyl-CoA thioesterase [Rhodocyclaceae bacterium]